MPRPRTTVKRKTKAARSTHTGGAVDLHFHGAFGVDLMIARPDELRHLASELANRGVAAFCPTTLSAGKRDLSRAVATLGQWISESRSEKTGALPLGIHLEGPFISPTAAGAHPPGIIRPVDFEELEQLWNLSRGTLKILTIAPEALKRPQDLKALARFCRSRKIRLSLGHSKATESQAEAAFDAGFSGVTHAWNALGFHHRAPGVLGAAIGRDDVWMELIPDGIHVDPTLIRWTLALHGTEKTCFVSDCAPAAATSPQTPDGDRWYTFGDLQIRNVGGVCRLADGSLAGGGTLLPETFAVWLDAEARTRGLPPARLLRETIGCIGRFPLEALGFRPPEIRRILARSRLRWKF